MPGLPLVPRRQPGRARVHRVRPGTAGEERVLPAVLGPAVRRPRLGRDRAPGGGCPDRGRREDQPSPAVLRPDSTAHGSHAGGSRAAPPAQGPPPGSRLGSAGTAVAACPPGPARRASPSLAAAIRIADRLAEGRGWSGEIRRRVRQGLAITLDGHQEGQDVAWSRALPSLRARHLCAGHVAEVLRQAGLLDDDRRPAFDAWLDRKLDGVTAGIRRDAGQQDLGQLRPARPRRHRRGAARRPPARGSPGHRRRRAAPGSHLRPGPRHRRPLRIQRPAAPPDRRRAAEPGRDPPEPKDRIRSRRLKTPQFPPASPQSG